MAAHKRADKWQNGKVATHNCGEDYWDKKKKAAKIAALMLNKKVAGVGNQPYFLHPKQRKQKA